MLVSIFEGESRKANEDMASVEKERLLCIMCIFSSPNLKEIAYYKDIEILVWK